MSVSSTIVESSVDDPEKNKEQKYHLTQEFLSWNLP